MSSDIYQTQADILFQAKNLNEGYIMLKDAVLVFDKKTQKHFCKKIFRQYLACGNIPKFDANHPKSYMFSDSELNVTEEIPKDFKVYIEYIKSIDSRYNQFVINFYETGNNFIEPHSDCDKDMVEDYRILILSLGQERVLRLTSRINKDIKIDCILKDKSIFLFDKDLNSNYRHEILKDSSTKSRISLTARMMRY